MDADFWLNRWQEGQIGFHQTEVHRLLTQHWPQLSPQLAPQAIVFVPLCGKSLDMLWLASQGYRVVGVELSELAVQQFFAEQNVQPDIERGDKFVSYRANNVTILCGDFFDLSPAHLGNVAAVYDRAALIALPQPLRQRYVEHLRNLVADGCQLLLVSIEYDEATMSGPPFSVPWVEISTLLDHLGELKILREQASNVRGTPCVERLYYLLYG